MNKLLIICDMFPPAFAPRMGYLCKYLTRMGWEVTVVTEYIEDNTFEFLTGYADVYCVRYYKASGKISKHIEWMWVMFLDILFGYKDMKIIQDVSDPYQPPFRRGFTRYYRAIRLQRIYIA